MILRIVFKDGHTIIWPGVIQIDGPFGDAFEIHRMKNPSDPKSELEFEIESITNIERMELRP